MASSLSELSIVLLARVRSIARRTSEAFSLLEFVIQTLVNTFLEHRRQNLQETASLRNRVQSLEARCDAQYKMILELNEKLQAQSLEFRQTRPQFHLQNIEVVNVREEINTETSDLDFLR